VEACHCRVGRTQVFRSERQAFLIVINASVQAFEFAYFGYRISLLRPHIDCREIDPIKTDTCEMASLT
jgi:hypothetical protein